MKLYICLGKKLGLFSQKYFCENNNYFVNMS